MTILRPVSDRTIAGRYRLLELLGKGSMSTVWLAEDAELGRRVAVKVLGPRADRSRFDREARAAAALSHPHLCGLFDYGEDGERAYMVLEYLPGGTLEERLAAGRLEDAETHRIAGEVASGLAHAHRRGLVHRDLKPANILFDVEGRAKIADFGIARMDGGGTLTEAGTVLGTATYISPEQAAGLPATPASDVYSLGVILFRMLTGRLPFVARQAMELVRMHRDDPPPTVAEVRPDTPPRLAALTDGMLVKDPLARPADGAAVVAALQGEASEDATRILTPLAAVDGADATAATGVFPPPSGPRRSRAPLLIAGAVALLVAGVAVALVASGGDDAEPAPTTTTAPLTLPTVPPAPTTAAETTEPATTEETTAETTTEEATTEEAPTTTAAPTTTSAPAPAPTTTFAPTTAATTVEPPPTTTAATTTAPTLPATTVETTVQTPTLPEVPPTLPVGGGR
jgi:serine/threonine-protein kinase